MTRSSPSSSSSSPLLCARFFAIFVLPTNHQCWCGVDVDLTRNGEALGSAECDMLCAGTTTGERCGGYYKISAYEIDSHVFSPGYIGCYADTPYWSIDAGEKYVSVNMTNEVS